MRLRIIHTVLQQNILKNYKLLPPYMETHVHILKDTIKKISRTQVKSQVYLGLCQLCMMEQDIICEDI